MGSSTRGKWSISILTLTSQIQPSTSNHYKLLPFINLTSPESPASSRLVTVIQCVSLLSAQCKCYKNNKYRKERHVAAKPFLIGNNFFLLIAKLASMHFSLTRLPVSFDTVCWNVPYPISKFEVLKMRLSPQCKQLRHPTCCQSRYLDQICLKASLGIWICFTWDD